MICFTAQTDLKFNLFTIYSYVDLNILKNVVPIKGNARLSSMHAFAGKHFIHLVGVTR